MAKPTNRQRLINAFNALGYRKVQNPSTEKYDVYIDPERPNRRWYIGRHGALRCGRTLATSKDYSSQIPTLLLQAEELIAEKFAREVGSQEDFA